MLLGSGASLLRQEPLDLHSGNFRKVKVSGESELCSDYDYKSVRDETSLGDHKFSFFYAVCIDRRNSLLKLVNCLKSLYMTSMVDCNIIIFARGRMVVIQIKLWRE